MITKARKLVMIESRENTMKRNIKNLKYETMKKKKGKRQMEIFT